jgi:ribosomal protein L7/L12
MNKTLKRSDIVDMIVRGMRAGRQPSIREDIDHARKILENYLNYDPTKGPLWVQDVELSLGEGRKLNAVKIVKDNTGWGLRECKDAVDYYEKWGNWNVTFNR